MATTEQQTILTGNRSTLGGAVSQLHMRKEGKRLCNDKTQTFPDVRTHNFCSNGTTVTSTMDDEIQNCKFLTKGKTLQHNAKASPSHKSNDRQVKNETKRSVSRVSGTSAERSLSSKTSLKPCPTMESKTKSIKYINNNARSINNGSWQQHPNPNRINVVKHSIYSRHMKTSTPASEDLENTKNMLQNGNSFSKQEMPLRDSSNFPKEELAHTQGRTIVAKVATKTETDKVKNKSPIGIKTAKGTDPTTTSTNKELQNQIQSSRHQRNIPELEERNTALEDLELAMSEKNFLQQLSDPRLKKSLQNIIKKRRDKVCLSEVVSENASNCESCYSNQDNNTDCKDNHPNGGNVSLAPTTDMENTSGNSTSCKISQANHELGNFSHTDFIPKDSISAKLQARDSENWSARTRSSARPNSRYSRDSRASVIGFRNHPESRSNKLSERPLSVYSGVSSSTSWNKRTRVSSCSSSRSKSREKANEVETEETRIILPSSDKGYRPCLTRQSTRLFSVQSSSAPLTRAVLKKRRTMNESDVIREFLIMYARIKRNNENNDWKPYVHDCEEPVQMISSVPELVVKSVIGQFLKEAFPSKRSTDQILGLRPSVEQKYEDIQRTKLLKIKTCMKHLASIV